MPSRYKNFFFYWLPILVYCFLIYLQSSYPAPESVPPVPYLDKLLHLAAYALLGALFLRAFTSSRIKGSIRLIQILSILFSSLYGISDEVHQYYVPFRNADPWDALADSVGSALGVYIYQAIAAKYGARRPETAELTNAGASYKKRDRSL